MRVRTGQQTSSRLRVEWVTSVDTIEALRTEWMALESKAQNRTVYATHDYVASWYRAYGRTRDTNFAEPLVGAVWEGAQLVGIAPFNSCKATLGKVPVRRLNFAGYIVQAGEFLALDGRPEILEAILCSLADRRDWDVLVLTNMQLDSDQTHVLRRTAQALRLGWEMKNDHSYAVADLREGYEAYANVRGSNFRKQARRHAQRVAQAGDWHVDRLDFTNGAAPVTEYLARMFRIADAGWRARERGLDEERRHHPFYRMLVERFARRGMVDLSILSIAGRDAAFTLALVERRVYFHLMVAYDHDMASYSPGAFLLQEVFRVLPHLNIHLVVSHGDYEYKRRWASQIVSQQQVFIFSRTLRGGLSRFSKFRVERAWERFQSVLHPAPTRAADGD